MGTTATGRLICLSRLRIRASRSSWIGLLIVSAALAQSPPVFKSESVSPSLVERMRHTTWHPGCPVPPEDLRQVTLAYLDFDGKTRTGTMVINKDLADEVMRIFRS